MMPTLYSYVNKNSSLERRGGIMGIASSMSTLANLIGAPLGGMLGAVAGLRAVFYLTGGVLMTSVIAVRSYLIDVGFDVVENGVTKDPGEKTTI
jgi:predicted MFS family arabinose efflux permease